MTMTHPRFSTLLLSALVASSVAIAQDNAPAPATPELTLAQCIARALQKNFDLEIGRYNPQIAKDSIDVARGGYDPLLTVSGSHGKSTTGATSLTTASSATTSDLGGRYFDLMDGPLGMLSAGPFDRLQPSPRLWLTGRAGAAGLFGAV